MDYISNKENRKRIQLTLMWDIDLEMIWMSRKQFKLHQKN